MRSDRLGILLGSAIACTASAEGGRPRGVGPEFAKFYKNAETFTCISSPSIVLPLSSVNDNYCDCPDGSDEPGTAACSYISSLSPEQPVAGSPSGTSNTSVALPGFYCKNKGHKPTYIPFTHVNDGVCDYDFCCDGSDEWEGVGGLKCPDRCGEIGREYKKLEAARHKAAAASAKKRAELVNEATRLRANVASAIEKLKAEVVSLEAKTADAKNTLEETQRRDRGRVVQGGEGKTSKVTILAGLAKNRIEELRQSLIGMVEKRDQAQSKVATLEAILSTFKDEYNPNFNDEGVKRAVKAWEDYAAGKILTDDVTVQAEARNIEDITKEDNYENGINWEEWKEEEESDVEALYRFEEYLPQAARDWLHQKVRDLRAFLVQNGVLADKSNAVTESWAVANARTAHETLSKSLNDKQNALSEQERDLGQDYGADDVFRAIKGQCVSQDAGEYTYELCWMDRTAQLSKKGGGSTSLGTFVSFEKTLVDEEVSADGKGLGSGERIVLKYDNGQHCWNGPNRRTTAVLACAEKDEIWKIIEEEKCVYRMEVGTPAVCEPAKKEERNNGKDEL